MVRTLPAWSSISPSLAAVPKRRAHPRSGGECPVARQAVIPRRSKENDAVTHRMGVEAVSLAGIEAVYRERYPAFLRTASAIADNREAGRDAVHDAFVNAIRGREAFRGEGTVEAWLWRMVVRSALQRRRQERGMSRTEAEAIWTDRLVEEHAEIRTAVAALPERQRLMLFLRYYGDLDYQAIADATGVRIGTVGAELHAAHLSLGRQLEEVESSG